MVLDLLLIQIDGAVSAGLYVLAMMAAVTVPDICSALRSQNGQTSARQYRKWYDDYAARHFAGMVSLSANTCYQLRCRLLHEGTQQNLVGHQTRVLFLPTTGITMDMCQADDALIVDVPRFCSRIRLAAEEWEMAEGNSTQVLSNAAKLVRVHPNGIPPFIVGAPVVG